MNIWTDKTNSAKFVEPDQIAPKKQLIWVCTVNYSANTY